MTQETRSSQTVAIIGSGGIGGFLAGQLVTAHRDVTLCVRTPVDQLVITRADGSEMTIPVKIAAEPASVNQVDWILVTTKAQDVTGIAGWLGRLVKPETKIVMIQNGVDHEARIRPLLKEAVQILPCIIMCAVERVSAGRLTHHGQAHMSVPNNETGQAFQALFANTEFGIILEEDFHTVAWTKLLGNAIANPLTALTLRRSCVFQNPMMAELARVVGREVIEVARATGAQIDLDRLESVLSRASAKADSGSSMLYDRLAERELEHEFITGAVVRAAEKHGIDVPVNRTILALLAGASGHSLKADN